MARYVVVANRTLAGDALSAHLGGLIAGDGDAQFRAVVPVVLPSPAALEVGGAMGGIAVVDTEGRAFALSSAQDRLDELLTWFRAVGVPASGEIVYGDPVPVVESIVAEGPVAEVVVSTLPAGFSRWLRMDLPQRLRRRIDVPITVLEATGDALVAPIELEDEPQEIDHRPTEGKQVAMGESVYKIVELVGTSTESWEKAAAAAVLTAQQRLRDLRIAEVVQLDLVVGDGAVTVYRAKVKVSFKYQVGD